jgi:hypothetical protein
MVAIGIAWMSTVGAFAAQSFSYTLSGNGQMAYDKDSNRLTGRDFKDGDYMYIQYAFTNTQCGTTGNACAPPRYSTFRLQKPDKDYSEGINVSPTATYILLKLCNDDTPPDTCSNWKRTTA